MLTTESIRSFPTPEPTPTIKIDFEPHQESYTYLLGETLVNPVNTFYAAVNESLTFTATIEFHVSDRYAVGYQWDFGDGSKGYSNPVTHTYTQTNVNLQVSFIVIDNKGVEWGVRKSMYVKKTTIAEALTNASVTDSLKHAVLPASFTQIPWAGTAGTDNESGFHFGSYLEEFEGAKAGSRSGIYYNTSKVEGGGGFVTINVATASAATPRQMGLWLFSEMTVNPSGYQVAVVGDGATYTFKLRKWVAGVETLLGETKTIPIKSGGSFGLVAKNGLVGAWSKEAAATPWGLVGNEVVTSTFTKGYSGLDGNGSTPNMINFSTGTL